MEKQLFIFHSLLSNTNKIEAIVDQFGFCEYSFWLSNINCREFLQQNIKWPVVETVSNIVKGIKDLKNFPGVIGAIDGSNTHKNTNTLPIKLHKSEVISISNSSGSL